jgi:hypothetical protein
MSGIATQSDPVATWFAVMRAATRSGDRSLAAMARRELEKLGYRIIVSRPSALRGAVQ